MISSSLKGELDCVRVVCVPFTGRRDFEQHVVRAYRKLDRLFTEQAQRRHNRVLRWSERQRVDTIKCTQSA